MFPFKKVTDFIACGKNQSKFQRGSACFGADQIYRTFGWGGKEKEGTNAYPTFTMCQTQALMFLLWLLQIKIPARIKFQSPTKGHQAAESQAESLDSRMV